MAASILTIGQTALNAAQVGLATTGHNIANASSAGFSRQGLVQSANLAQNGYGSGTTIAAITRNYNAFLDTQVNTAETSKNLLETHYTEISQIANMLADPSSGLAPALQDFFKGVQDLSANPNSVASRQAVLSSAQAMASRFQGIDDRLTEMRDGINSEINTSIGVINRYAEQIAKLNDSIALVAGNTNRPPNDLMDQRDQLITELSQQTNVSTFKQTDGSYTVSVGSGQPLVVGNTPFYLVSTTSPTDLSRVVVGFKAGAATVAINEGSMPGGKLGGYLDFRRQTLDSAQNTLGLIAAGLSATYNAQHRLGQDDNGAMGGDFFVPPTATTTPSVLNNQTTNGVVSATILDASILEPSDYVLKSTNAGASMTLTRQSDGKVLANTDLAAAQLAANSQGFDFQITSGSFSTGDVFMIKPVVTGAQAFNVAITDKAKIAAAAPVRTTVSTTNTGTGRITPGSVDSTFLQANLVPTVTLTYDANSVPPSLNGFPAAMPVTVTNAGVSTVFAAGAAVDFTAGSTISFGGVTVSISGVPANGDTFTVGQNTSGLGDNRNAVLLGALQGTNQILGKVAGQPTASFQGAYAQFVSEIGNKTRELQVTSSSGATLLSQAKLAQQTQAGVNLDEEAANLLRYQQAFQAAGKVIQVSNQMFDTLLQVAAGR